MLFYSPRFSATDLVPTGTRSSARKPWWIKRIFQPPSGIYITQLSVIDTDGRTYKTCVDLSLFSVLLSWLEAILYRRPPSISKYLGGSNTCDRRKYRNVDNFRRCNYMCWTVAVACPRGAPGGARRSVILPPRPPSPPSNDNYWYNTKQDDSIKAFEVSVDK